MKPNFDLLMKEIHKFEKKAGFDKTSKKQIIKWFEEEIKNYKNAKTAVIRRNKLMDILILDLQLARREGYSLDDAWKRWWQKSQKYLGKNKERYVK